MACVLAELLLYRTAFGKDQRAVLQLDAEVPERLRRLGEQVLAGTHPPPDRITFLPELLE
jgi:hypothetical protein